MGRRFTKRRISEQIVSDSTPEGTLRLVIKNFSLMTDTVRGPSKVVQGVPWRLMGMPRYVESFEFLNLVLIKIYFFVYLKLHQIWRLI